MEDLLHLTPLGFERFPFSSCKADLALSLAYAQGDYALAESFLNGASTRIQVEYLFATGQLEACAELITPPPAELRFAVNLNLPNFSQSAKPLKVLELTSFVRDVENKFLPCAHQHTTDNLYDNLPSGCDIIDYRSSPPRLWMISPAGGLVLVYFQSMEHELCLASRLYANFTLPLFAPFRGKVPNTLLAEALFCANHLAEFEQVVLSFPEECKTHIKGLNAHHHCLNEILRIQALLDVVLLRRAARQAVQEALA